VIQQLAQTYPVKLICEVWGFPRSTFYYPPRPPADRDLRTALVQQAAAWPTHGSRWLTKMLRREGWPVNRKRIRRLMRLLGLQRKNKRQTVWTTQSRHGFQRFPNLVRDREVTAPDQVWVADITYVRLRFEFVYLAIVMDVFTRNIRGWHLARSLDGRLSRIALERALAHHQPGIHHSDQGIHYAAPDYVARLQQVQVQISMSEKGAAWQNGYAERVIRTIKEEEVGLSEYRTYAEAYDQLGRFIDEVYTHKRIHSSLGYMTPAEFEEQWQAANQNHPSDPHF
jgi:putative transposase